MILTIRGRMPGLNEYVHAMNRNRHAGNAMKRKWTNLVRDEAIAQGLTPVETRQDFVFMWVEPNRKRDKDNVEFAKKFILDGLVRAKVLPNDGWSWVGRLDNTFEVSKDDPRVVVVMTDEQE